MQIFAHRGASGYEQENTLEAIKLALELKVDGIEIDVYAVDDELIVFHDRWLDQKTNGTGVIFKQSLDYIQKLKIKGKYKIPRLIEVLEIINCQAVLNIELKDLLTLNPLIKLYSNLDINQRSKIIISSFNHHLLQNIKQELPTIDIAPLIASIPLDYAQSAFDLNASAIHCDFTCLDKELILDAKSRGLKVRAYTVNEAEDILDAKDLGIDAIFTDYPYMAYKLLKL